MEIQINANHINRSNKIKLIDSTSKLEINNNDECVYTR